MTNTLRNVTSRRFRIPNEFGIFTVLVVVYLILSFQSPYFATYSNMMDLLLNGSVIAFLALGQMLVLLTGGIDLSLGGVIATTGIIAAIVMEHGLPWWIAGVCALACGAIAGAINGILIHYVKIPAFIVTFAMMGVASSIPLILTQGGSVTVNDQTFSLIGQGHILTVPVPVVLVVVAAIVVGVLLKITKFGVHVYAVGGNAAAARLSGVSLARITVTVYSLSGFFAGFGGLIITSRLMIGFPASGLGNELFYSIAAAVVGGVSLFGGIGTVLGAMIGAILIATVTNGMNIINVNSYWQSLVIGIIILVGVGVDTNRRRFAGLPMFARIGTILRRSPESITEGDK